MKQAFGGNNQDQSQNRQQNGRQQQHAGQQQSQPQQHQSQHNRQTDTTTARNRQQQYAEPIHFEQSAMNVMDDNTVMEMLEDLEPGR